MFYPFRYEEEFLPTLSRLPLHVRMKLDLAGMKFSLKDWLALSMEERTVLCHLPADNEEEKQAFTAYLDFLCRKVKGAPAQRMPPAIRSLWDNPDQIPPAVMERSISAGAGVTLQQWQRWNSHQRYALYKTAISKNEPEKFAAVLEELNGSEG